MNYDDWKQQTPPSSGKYFTYEKEKPKVVNEKYEEYMKLVREKNQLKKDNK